MFFAQNMHELYVASEHTQRRRPTGILLCIIVQVVGLALNRGILSKHLSLAQTIAVLSGPVSFEDAENKQSASKPFWPSLVKVPVLVLLLHWETFLRDSTGLQQQLHHLLYGEAAELGLPHSCLCFPLERNCHACPYL